MSSGSPQAALKSALDSWSWDLRVMWSIASEAQFSLANALSTSLGRAGCVDLGRHGRGYHNPRARPGTTRIVTIAYRLSTQCVIPIVAGGHRALHSKRVLVEEVTRRELPMLGRPPLFEEASGTHPRSQRGSSQSRAPPSIIALVAHAYRLSRSRRCHDERGANASARRSWSVSPVVDVTSGQRRAIHRPGRLRRRCQRDHRDGRRHQRERRR